MGERVIVTHTDLDGVAAAAIVVGSVGEADRLMFAQPHQLAAVFAKIPNGAEVYVSDLGINQLILGKVAKQVRRIVGSGGAVRWFDHHRWEEEWVMRLREAGAEIYVDTGTCGTGVVAKYLPANAEWVKELVSAACSVDLWLFNDWRGNYLARYVGYGGTEWKRMVVAKLVGFSGIDEEIEEVAEEVVSRELETLTAAVTKAVVVSSGGGLRAVAYFKSRDDNHLTSFIASLLMNRFDVDVAIICRKGSLSFRSRRDIDVSKAAKLIGGGGHPRAAGAKLDPPLWRLLLSLLGIRGPLFRWCVNIALNALERAALREDLPREVTG